METKSNSRDAKAKKFMDSKKGALGGTVSFVIGIVILIMVVTGLALPTIKTSANNLTGTDATMILFTGTLLIILIVTMITNMM